MSQPTPPKPWALRQQKIDSDTAAYCQNRKIEFESPDRFYTTRMFSRLFGGGQV